MTVDTDTPPRVGTNQLGVIDPNNYTLIEQAGGTGTWAAVVRHVLSEDAALAGGFCLDGDVEMGNAIVDEAVKAIRYAWLLTQEQLGEQPNLTDGPWVHTTRIVDAGIHGIVLRSRLLHSIEDRLPTGRWALEHVPLDDYTGGHAELVGTVWRGMTDRGLEPRSTLWQKEAALVASPIRWYRR